MGRIRKPTLGLNPTLSDIFGHGISTHRTCWLHIVAHRYHSKSNITWEEVKEIKKKYRHTSPCYSRTLPHHRRLSQEHSASESRNGMDNHAAVISRNGCKLDTYSFECYMESIWSNFSENERMSFSYLDSLWFSLYREPTTRPKVLSWIKKKAIFSKNYVFVPIVCWDHWSLLILVHFDESSDSERKIPCMLLLDSLANAEPKRLEPEIRKFVVDIYKAEGRTEDKKRISEIPLLIPKVPQQRNDEECGSFVLYFIHLFMKSAPENFSISHGCPYFMSQDWFKPEDFDSFREKLEKEPPRKQTKGRAIRSSRILRSKTPMKSGITFVDD